MQRSSARRGQLDPVPALIAVVVVGLGMSLYAGVVTDFLPSQQVNPTPTLHQMSAQLQTNGVVEPETLTDLDSVGPAGYETNVTLETAAERWTRGPTPPTNAVTARARVSIRVAPGCINPGWLTVRMWQ
ncbi:hypothetical protein [Haladaptatus sp. DJG-WS-42]|uniref:DUF7285 family protein n=1 Tax=Haladaptatus sp. DJG-WS-42 TaxID=3120516 RepID=UPI0030CF5659